MAKGQKKSNKEIRKPKAEKPKKNASQPSLKVARSRGWRTCATSERAGRYLAHPGRCRRLPGQGRGLPRRLAPRGAGQRWSATPAFARAGRPAGRAGGGRPTRSTRPTTGSPSAPDARAVVITGDILLADRCLKAGATVIAPNGKPFTAGSIGARDRDPRDHGRPARRGRRDRRRPAALRQGGPLALPPGARHRAGQALALGAGLLGLVRGDQLVELGDPPPLGRAATGSPFSRQVAHSALRSDSRFLR